MSNEVIVYVVGGLVWIVALFVATRPKSRARNIVLEFFKWTVGLGLGFLALSPLDLLPFTSWDGVLLGIGAFAAVFSAIEDGETRRHRAMFGFDKEPPKQAKGE